LGAMVFFLILFSFLIFSFLEVTNEAAGQEHLILNTGAIPPLSSNNQKGFLDLISKEALGRLGIEVTTVRVPAERALLNAN